MPLHKSDIVLSFTKDLYRFGFIEFSCIFSDKQVPYRNAIILPVAAYNLIFPLYSKIASRLNTKKRVLLEHLIHVIVWRIACFQNCRHNRNGIVNAFFSAWHSSGSRCFVRVELTRNFKKCMISLPQNTVLTTKMKRKR